MMLKLVTLGTLGLATLMPAVASADHERDLPNKLFGLIERIAERYGGDRDDRGRDDRGRDDRGRDRDDHADRVWIEGHYESRETKRMTPPVLRQVWVPDRCEEVCIPAVTERVCIPAVTERVYCPPVTERCLVPEVRERCFVPGHYESRTDARGCRTNVWIEGHSEERVVRAAHYEERVIRPGHYEQRVVKQECWEQRIVTPERRETRVIERGHYQTVVVSPERCDVVVEKVWVPAHWEVCKPRQRA